MSNKTKAELERELAAEKLKNVKILSDPHEMTEKYNSVPHGERCNNRLGFLCNCHKSQG